MQRRDAVALRRVDVGALLDHRQHVRAIAAHRRVGDRSRTSGAGVTARQYDRGTIHRVIWHRPSTWSSAARRVAWQTCRTDSHASHAGSAIQIEAAGAVAERLHLHPQHLRHRDEHVRHRRPVGRLEVEPALQLPAGLAGQEQRASLVVVQIRIAHRRPVDDQRVVEQTAVAVGRPLQPLEEIRHQADVILVDLRELENPLFAARRGATRCGIRS